MKAAVVKKSIFSELDLTKDDQTTEIDYELLNEMFTQTT